MNQDLKKAIDAMLNKRLFVMVREAVDVEVLDALLPAHLEWMLAREQEGSIFLSGPFTSPDARPGTLGGLTVINASSAQDAARIASQDPFVTEGGLRYAMNEWSVMEGSLTITVTLSSQRITLD